MKYKTCFDKIIEKEEEKKKKKKKKKKIRKVSPSYEFVFYFILLLFPELCMIFIVYVGDWLVLPPV
jgi:cytoskeletal protein RodZ